MINRANSRRIAIALAIGGVLLVGYPAVSGGVLWDFGAACGYACLILFVCLYVFPVRGDGLPHARLLGLSQHKSIGWGVLGTAAAHVVVVLLAEPQTGRYLVPSAPVFMWCGVAALLCVVGSVVTGLSARSHMRRSPAPAVTAASSPRSGASASRPTISTPRAATSALGAMQSRATLHVVLAAVLMLTACAHVIGSSQLLIGTLKTAVVLLLLSLPLGWYALRQRPMRQNVPGASPARLTARRVSHVAAITLIALLPTSMSKQILLEPAARPSIIAVNFPHDSHTSVSCVTCHHNYVDQTGTQACIECHRSARTKAQGQPHRVRHEQAMLIGGDRGPGPRAASAAPFTTDAPFKSAEQTFHTFCRDCHTQLALDHLGHGPTRSCSTCHPTRALSPGR